MKLIIVRGISGSGKSTWSAKYKDEHPNTLVVNRDKLRALVFGSESDYGIDEDLITHMQNAFIIAGFNNGYDVVVDNTNIYEDYLEELAWLANDFNAEIVIHLIDVPLELALKQNSLRDRVVPEEVIRRQYNMLQHTKNWRPR